MEIVFFFLSNLKSTLSSLRQCLGLPPKRLLEVRLYWKQFTHYLVHIAILSHHCKGRALNHGTALALRIFLTFSMDRSLDLLPGYSSLDGLGTTPIPQIWGLVKPTSGWSSGYTATYLFLRCSPRQQKYGTHLCSRWWLQKGSSCLLQDQG